MLSHGGFFAALLVYYIPKLFGKKTKLIVNLHIILGSLSVVGMLYETIMKIGTDSFLQYAGFSGVMLAIAWTGYLITKYGKPMVKWHIIATLSFFAYLMLIIIL